MCTRSLRANWPLRTHEWRKLMTADMMLASHCGLSTINSLSALAGSLK